MATQMITLKMDSTLLNEIDTTVKKQGYQNRTEFIRNAVHEKLDLVKYKQALSEIAHLKGASKKKTTDEELHKIREKVFEEFDKKLK